MKNFLIKLLKLLVGFYIILWALQFVLDNGLKRNKNDLHNEWYKIQNTKINADVIFLGSSRTVKHYDPKIFDKRLNVNSYNLGVNGTRYDLQHIKMNTYLKYNEKPKIIIQNVDISALEKNRQIFEKEQYLPYYTLDNYQYLKRLDNTITLEYVLPMYKYRGYFNLTKDILEGYFSDKPSKKSIHYKGYNGRDMPWDNRFEEEIENKKDKLFDYSKRDFDIRFEVFNELLEPLKNTNADIFLIWAPEYYERIILEGKTLLDIKARYSEIARVNDKIYFLDFTTDSLCNSKDNFYNSYHLNKAGAEMFSNKVVDSIKKHLKLNYK